MPVHLGSAAIDAAYLGASAVDKVYLGANAVYTALAPPAQVAGLAADATGDGTIDLSWTAPASDATITDYSVEYTDVQPLTGVALLAPFDADLDDVLGITGTATNTPTVTSGGKFGSFCDIGVADKLVYSGIDDGGGDWTVEFFIKRTDAALSGAGYVNSANRVLRIPGVLQLVTANSSTAIAVQEADYSEWVNTSPLIVTPGFDGEWHHIALVRDGGTLRVYFDGVQLGSFSSSASVSSLEFGNASVYSGVFGLDDLRVSTSAVYPGGTTFTPPTTAHPTSGGGTTATVLVGSATTSYQLTSLTNDTEYSVRVAAVSAAGTGAYSTAVTGTPGAFSPAGITGLQLWLDASDASTLYDATSGGSLVAADGSVARWEDKSGNGYHATQSSGSYRPTRKLSLLNGNDGLSISNDQMFTNVSYSTTDHTFFVVAKPFSLAGGTRYYLDSPGPNNLVFAQAAGTSKFGWYDGVWQAPDSASISNVDQVLCFRLDGSLSSGEIFQNGNSLGTASYSATGIGGGVSIFSAAWSATFGNADGNVYEMILYEGALSTGDRAAVENYLLAKWGITP